MIAIYIMLGCLAASIITGCIWGYMGLFSSYEEVRDLDLPLISCSNDLLTFLTVFWPIGWCCFIISACIRAGEKRRKMLKKKRIEEKEALEKLEEELEELEEELEQDYDLKRA